MHPSLPDRARYRSYHFEHGPRFVAHEVDGDTWNGFESIRLLPGVDAEIALIPLVGHSPRPHGDRGPRRATAGCCTAATPTSTATRWPTRPTARSALRAFQSVMAADRSARHRNEQRLHRLAGDSSAEVRLFCSHDPVELERMRA